MRPWSSCCGLLLVLALALPAHGQEISARAYLSPGETVGVGAPFVLNVEVTGTQAVSRALQLPDLQSFATYLGSNTQSSVRSVNGRTSVSFTMQYRYQALTEGRYTIPSFEVTAEGRTFATEPLDITVSASGTGQESGTTGLGPDDLFITAEASKTTVLEGEPLIVEYRIWTQVDVSSFGMSSVPEPEGFWVEDVTPGGGPEVEQIQRDGVQYATAVVRRVALIPTGPGERTLEPIGIEAQVRVRNERDPFGRAFGRSSLFGTTTVPTTVLSNELTIDVQPLPAGRPEPFTGVVGSLRVTTDLDRDSVESNDAVTLTVRVSGEGNVRALAAPELGLPDDFEVFPPEVSESIALTGTGLSGSKTFEYVVIPRAPGQREIPPVRFAYFDEAAGAYRTAESAVLPLTVSGTAIEGPAALARGGVEQFRQDIRFIRLGSLELRQSGGPLTTGFAFWLFALLPLAGIVGAVGLSRHWDLLEGDVAYARGRRAGRVAKKRLAEARRLAQGDDGRAFYAEVARALTGLVSDRLNLAEAGLQTTDLASALDRAGVAESIRSEVLGCLSHCDHQRFAPPGTDPEEKSRFLTRVADLMTALDKVVR